MNNTATNTLVNTTPHTAHVELPCGATIDLPKSQNPSRATVTTEHVRYESINGKQVELVREVYGTPENLPEPEFGVVLLVSRITAQAAQAAGRPVDDLRIPAVIIRDEQGRITGCTKFAVL